MAPSIENSPAIDQYMFNSACLARITDNPEVIDPIVDPTDPDPTKDDDTTSTDPTAPVVDLREEVVEDPEVTATAEEEQSSYTTWIILGVVLVVLCLGSFVCYKIWKSR